MSVELCPNCKGNGTITLYRNGRPNGTAECGPCDGSGRDLHGHTCRIPPELREAVERLMDVIADEPNHRGGHACVGCPREMLPRAVAEIRRLLKEMP